MRRLIAWLFGWKIVYLLDFDGEVCCRLAQPSPFGWTAYRMSRVFGIGKVLLLPNGRTRGACYVDEWRPAEGFPANGGAK